MDKTNEIMAEIKQLMYGQGPGLTAEQRERLDCLLTSGIKVDQHVKELIKSRKFKFSGDRSHISVCSIDDLIRDVDKPRKYEFQDADVNEQELIRALSWDFPMSVVCDSAKVISGDEQATGPSYFSRCYDCGKPLFTKVRGDEITMEGDGPCQSNAKFSVIVEFPTGVVLADDWPTGFQDWMELEVEDGDTNEARFEGPSINYLSGIRYRTEKFASANIAHFFVGNSCPAIMKTSDGALALRPDEDDVDGEELVTICTDLWWATMIDVEYWSKMLSDLGDNEQQIKEAIAAEIEAGNIINIEPGVYEFVYENVQLDDEDQSMARRVTGRKIR